MCGYCIESGFVFDFWQKGEFTLPAPYHADTGESTIDFTTACYALFEAPSPAQLSGPWLLAAQTETPYWPLRQLEQALLALPVAIGEIPDNGVADLEKSLAAVLAPDVNASKDRLPDNPTLTVSLTDWPTLSALWQHWQQPQAAPSAALPAAIDHKLLNEARACLRFALLPFEHVQDCVNNYLPELDDFTANEAASKCFYGCFAEAWLAFCLLRRFVPFDPLLIRWSAAMPKHVPSFGGEDLVMIRQAFWHCLSLYGAPYFIEHGPHQRAELLAYAAKRFAVKRAPLATSAASPLDLKAFYQLLNQHWQGGIFTVFSIEQAMTVIEAQLTATNAV